MMGRVELRKLEMACWRIIGCRSYCVSIFSTGLGCCSGGLWVRIISSWHARESEIALLRNVVVGDKL